MSTGFLTIELDAVTANWRALDEESAPQVETAAVVKADGYGLGAGCMTKTLARAGTRKFFVAVAEEGAEVREATGGGTEIFVLTGHMHGDTQAIGDSGLIPMLNSPDQVTRHLRELPDRPFGLQLDTGMNRLGLEPEQWAELRDTEAGRAPRLIASHLACADIPDHPMNTRQLRAFREMTDGVDAPRSLSATGGILLGADYHFDMTRPGVGIYGGLPFGGARPVVSLSVPVIQVRELLAGETVGYGNTWRSAVPSRIATVSAGYADGLPRTMSDKLSLWANDVPCPVAGRISMDLIGVDITHLPEVPERLEVLNGRQTVDTLAEAAGTIGYEILTSLGSRYTRRYVRGAT